MHDKALTGRLNSEAVLSVHLEALMRIDSRLGPIREASGDFPVRVNPAGFVGITKIICGQQLSVASARAIWARFEAVPGALEPAEYLKLDEASVRATGFSLAKYRTVRVIAEAVVKDELDFAHVERLSAEAAVAYLTAHKGIGPWTAEIYLMSCAGHPDIFPAGDLALQKAVAHGLGLDARPSIKQLIAIAEAWSPHRAAAALLFWRYYAVIRDREGIIF